MKTYTVTIIYKHEGRERLRTEVCGMEDRTDAAQVVAALTDTMWDGDIQVVIREQDIG